jgi:C-terminal processing protease CtpA/Prc
VVGGVTPQYWHYRANSTFISSLAEIDGGLVLEDPSPNSGPVLQGTRQAVALPVVVAEVRQWALPVAVLVGKYTSSSGEGIAVSLIGRPRTRTFGTRTSGRSSGNIGFKLSGGEMLIVTYGPFADRNGNIYSPAVVPDQEVETARSVSTADSSDDAVASALQWIHGQRQCALPRTTPASSPLSRPPA